MGMYMQSADGNTNDYVRRGARTQNRVNFLSMVRGEMMKVTWLRSTWIMLAVVISGTAMLPLLSLAVDQNMHKALMCEVRSLIVIVFPVI